MWPFSRKPLPRIESVQLANISTEQADYPVLTVGQSRLESSFDALEFGDDSDVRFAMATIAPVVDPSMGLIADLEIRVQDHVVGYLRPPALTTAIVLLETHRADSLTVPVMLLTTPAGPEVRVHTALG